MSTTQDFVEYVTSQIDERFAVRYRKMFGEYMVYVNDKPILLVCDNTVFVKMLPELADLMANAETDLPYDSAKEHYVLDIENTRLVDEVISVLEPITPLPKPRKKRA
jgi:TfoX/Sxy family transcriptional regulator of competence genes